ncbi:SymE family type I addiction module toxin [Leclercia adecarboxylata]|uniref:SymE family type I addiction module toxin n=1 Tax=Leclercia adecarboxylata TaxID=83655 RepID=UPI003AF1CA0A
MIPELLKSIYPHHHLVFRSPSLRLNGNWLREAGFSTDTLVMVSVEQERLVIEPVRS